MDRFTIHQGWLPVAKTRHAVYRCFCSCGATYVGESERNLKLRISEHLTASSRSAFSDHLQNNGHRPSPKDTLVIGCEKNKIKWKLLETIAIDHSWKNKEQKLCNAGVSSDFPAIWQICTRAIRKQLDKKK